jgi:hypothetical protein
MSDIKFVKAVQAGRVFSETFLSQCNSRGLDTELAEKGYVRKTDLPPNAYKDFADRLHRICMAQPMVSTAEFEEATKLSDLLLTAGYQLQDALQGGKLTDVSTWKTGVTDRVLCPACDHFNLATNAFCESCFKPLNSLGEAILAEH